MNKIFLGNVDYKTHTTNEGDELQQGMRYAGWILSGLGFDDRTDVRDILDLYRPGVVLVHDKRDWDRNNGGCYRPEVSYANIGALRDYPAFRLGVVKDAGSVVDYHRRFIEDDIDAHAVITYYHDESILRLSPFLNARRRIRTYHSLDLVSLAQRAGRMWSDKRKESVVSGALNNAVYPFRQKIVASAAQIGCEIIKHPGYGNARSATPDFLARLSTFKVSLATASKYGFALRKIIESVAVGAIPITDLPAYDELPEIDGALWRVDPNISIADLRGVVKRAALLWDAEERRHWAEKAWKFYNWHAIGLRLSGLIDGAAVAEHNAQ